MKESNNLVDNVGTKLLQRVILSSTKRKCMKESNILANNAAINILQRQILLDT